MTEICAVTLVGHRMFALVNLRHIMRSDRETLAAFRMLPSDKLAYTQHDGILSADHIVNEHENTNLFYVLAKFENLPKL